jgi:uncharacterized protein (DUF488 family)
MKKAHVATIGFTQTTAEHFFERLRAARIKTVFDVRLNNTSQLAGFAKAADLAYFLRAVAGIGYEHQPLLCPTEAIMKGLRANLGKTSVYQGRFLELMAERRIETRFKPATFEGACLLCSEVEAHNCHRRLVCDYLNDKWGGTLAVTHL